MLIPGGRFHFVTDSEAYFEKKQALISKLGLFSLQEQIASFEGGRTRYQQYWEAFDVLSWRADYVK